MISENILKAYADHIKADYLAFMKRSGNLTPIQQKMYDDFKIEFEPGRVYIKVIKSSMGDDRSVHSFIMIEGDNRFAAGDILKAAGWNAPAKNKPRGNVLKGEWSRARWTGIS